MTDQQWDWVIFLALLGLNLWTFLRYSHWRARCLAAEMTGRFLQECVNYCDKNHAHIERRPEEHA